MGNLNMNYSKYLFLIPAVLSFNLFAQDTANSSDVEEVVIVGSQIKGAKITGALPVSIITSDDIESLGIESGEELFQAIAENGSNNFNQTDFNGGYNANRGDVGALDLRNIGTGNTVTLLNGRRIVNSPGYATEWVGGSYVPVTSVNSNVIPVYGADRVEILRDGASAIYGADAVAGVVNTVLKKDFEGTTVRLRTNWYDSFAANDNKASIQWGKDFANGTNVSVYFDHYDRGRLKMILIAHLESEILKRLGPLIKEIIHFLLRCQF
jgi:outer membrane receptor protein involved in Fe transport